MKLFPKILIHMLNQFILASFADNMKTDIHVEHSEIHVMKTKDVASVVLFVN